jgi:hypothetical protein
MGLNGPGAAAAGAADNVAVSAAATSATQIPAQTTSPLFRRCDIDFLPSVGNHRMRIASEQAHEAFRSQIVENTHW